MTKKYTIHETAIADEGSSIGEGTGIWHFSHIMKGAKVGKRCRIGQNVVIHPTAIVGDGVKIQNNVTVYDGVVLDDDVFCGPACVFTNIMNPRSEVDRNSEEFFLKTHVKKGSTIGANATIVCGVTLGQYSFIGAGSVVTKGVPDYGLVMGNPARLIGYRCECGDRINFNETNGECSSCKKKYKRDKTSVTRV